MMDIKLDENTSNVVCIVIGILCFTLVLTKFIGCASAVEQNRHVQRMEKIEKGTEIHPHN